MMDFEGRIYEVGLSYEYKDLPSTSQEDARNSASTEEDLEGEGEAKKYVYELVLIPHARAKEVAEEISRKIKVSGWSLDRAQELADDIAESGLWNKTRTCFCIRIGIYYGHRRRNEEASKAEEGCGESRGSCRH